MDALPLQKHDILRPTLRTRLAYGVGMFGACLATVYYACVYSFSSIFDGSGKNFKKWSSRWGRAVFWGFGVNVSVTNRVALDPEKPYVFVSNHQNSFDVTALAIALPCGYGFVAKAELERVPFLGFAIRNSPSVFIDRRDPRRAIASLREAGKRIREGQSVLVFAEGSRANEPTLRPFKRGAFMLAVEAGVPIVPVTVCNAYQMLDEKRYMARRGTIQVVIGSPISLEGKTRKDIPALMQSVRSQMEDVLSPTLT